MIEFTGSDFSSPLAYAWGDNVTTQAVGSFYRPVQQQGSTDTFFTYVTDHMSVESSDGAGTSTPIDSTLGEQGWTLPYDRATLCAAVTSAGGGPYGVGPTQFISAGVATTTVSGHPTWRKLVPTFAFKGDVTPLASWGTLSWSIPNLTLQFAGGKKLDLDTPLNASGTLMTAVSPAAGWGGVRFNAGSGGAWTNTTTVELVAGGDPSSFIKSGLAAVTVENASPTLTNVTIQAPVAGTELVGLKVTGSSAVPVATDLFVTDMTARGILVDGGARLDLFRGTVTGSNGPAVGAAGTGTRAYLRRALTGDQRGPQISLNGGDGVAATSSAEVRFGTDSTSAPGYGYASITDNGNTGASGHGLFATSGADIYAGTGTVAAGSYQRNRVYGNGGSSPTGNAYATGTGSTVYARCTWWNTTDQAAFRVGSASGGLTDASYYLTSDPYVMATPACAAANQTSGRAAGRTARHRDAARRGTPGEETDDLDRLAEAMSAATPAEAVALLSALVADLPETEAAVAALGEAGQLAEQAGAPMAASVLVTGATASAHAALRVAAWQALVAMRRAAGDASGALAATDALALEGAAVQAEVARVYLYVEAADTTASLASLAVLEALAPGSVEAELARALVAPDEAPAEGKSAGDAPSTPAARVAAASAGLALAVAPNPAGTAASVVLTLAEAADVTVAVYDLLGRAVATLTQGERTAGTYRASLDVAALAPGVYACEPWRTQRRVQS